MKIDAEKIEAEKIDAERIDAERTDAKKGLTPKKGLTLKRTDAAKIEAEK